MKMLMMLLGLMVAAGSVSAQNINRATGLVVVQDGDTFGWKIVNNGQSNSAAYRVKIFSCTSSTCSLVLDSGTQWLGAGKHAGWSYTVAAGEVKELYGVATYAIIAPIIFSARTGPSCPSVPCTIRSQIQPGDLTLTP